MAGNYYIDMLDTTKQLVKNIDFSLVNDNYQDISLKILV